MIQGVYCIYRYVVSIFQVVLQLPVFITSLVALVFAFWPRVIYAPLFATKKKENAFILGSALTFFVMNLFGLILIEVWAPLVSIELLDYPHDYRLMSFPSASP